MKQRVDAPASPGAIFGLVRQGTDTRGAIARATGLAPSTVSQRVETLLAEGFLEERSKAAPTGGRRARALHVRGDAGVVAAATLGATHARILVADLSCVPLFDSEEALDVTSGPEAVVAEVWERIRTALTSVGKTPDDLRGIALGLPAPVDSRSGSVSPSVQLPGWDLVAVYDLLGKHTQAPAVVENDANLLAVAEASLAGREAQHLLAVKIGSRIGSGFISAGTLHQGASGAAGEISHTPTSGTSMIPCSCGTENCLESVASGSAIAARLRSQGRQVGSAADLLELASAGDHEVITALRDAGRLVGEVLAEIVNFLNPHVVVFGGALSAATPFVAAVRGTLFQRCLPVVTAVLDVRVGGAGRSAEALGGVRLVLERTFTPEAVDQAIARRRAARR